MNVSIDDFVMKFIAHKLQLYVLGRSFDQIFLASSGYMAYNAQTVPVNILQ